MFTVVTNVELGWDCVVGIYSDEDLARNIHKGEFYIFTNMSPNTETIKEYRDKNKAKKELAKSKLPSGINMSYKDLNTKDTYLYKGEKVKFLKKSYIQEYHSSSLYKNNPSMKYLFISESTILILTSANIKNKMLKIDSNTEIIETKTDVEIMKIINNRKYDSITFISDNKNDFDIDLKVVSTNINDRCFKKYEINNKIYSIYIISEENIIHNDYISVGTWDQIEYKGMIVGKENYKNEKLLFYLLESGKNIIDFNDKSNIKTYPLTNEIAEDFGEIDIKKVGDIEISCNGFTKLIC